MDVTALKAWFLKEKRHLPWRINPSPYSVWVSEVMLQQTQVSVVIPYFNRWMQRFPSLKDLADASVDVVIKMWEGLGYYSRARNLHEGAKYVLENYGGVLPNTKCELLKIKGLGEYTVGAILNFAFHRKEVAIDGNVLRVLSRFYLINEDICKSSVKKKIHSIARDLLPEEEPWIFSEALIELGALICQKKPSCYVCPMRTKCLAYRDGLQDIIPIKSKKIVVEKLNRVVCLFTNNQNILVVKREKGKIMQDLHEFPFLEVTEKGINEMELPRLINEKWKIESDIQKKLKKVSHSFTRYRVDLYPYLLKIHEKIDIKGHDWIAMNQLQNLAFSSGHRKIVKQIYC